ncbi:MAG: aminotransferase class I/II-fold pyridoxal phosphate-dependent enzyme, partial [Burkholderiaceae bacterium]
AIRALADAGVSFFVANSFSKSFSLYGERVGGLSVVCANKEEADRVFGQLQATIRRNYSSPATHGGQVVARVLNTPELFKLWEDELGEMRDRIKAMRTALHGVLSAKVPGRNFDYFLTQRGMFSYTGLSGEQVDRLKDEHGIYLVRSGRVCIAGLNTKNVEQVATAIAQVLA